MTTVVARRSPAARAAATIKPLPVVPKPEALSLPVDQAIVILIRQFEPEAVRYYRVSYGLQGLLEDVILLLRQYPTASRVHPDDTLQVPIWARKRVVSQEEFSSKTTGRKYGDKESYIQSLTICTLFALQALSRVPCGVSIGVSKEGYMATVDALQRRV